MILDVGISFLSHLETEIKVFPVCLLPYRVFSSDLFGWYSYQTHSLAGLRKYTFSRQNAVSISSGSCDIDNFSLETAIVGFPLLVCLTLHVTVINMAMLNHENVTISITLRNFVFNVNVIC